MTWLSSFAFWFPWCTAELFIRAFKIKKKTSKQTGDLCNCAFPSQPSTLGKGCRSKTFPTAPSGPYRSSTSFPLQKKMAEEQKWNPSRVLVFPANGATCLSHIALASLSYQWFCYAQDELQILSWPCSRASLFSPPSDRLEQRSKVKEHVDGGSVTVTWWTSQSPLVVVDSGQTFPRYREITGQRSKADGSLWETWCSAQPLRENQPTFSRIWGKQFCRQIVVKHVLIKFLKKGGVRGFFEKGKKTFCL